MSEVSSRSRRAGDDLRVGEHRVADERQRGRERRPRVARRHGAGIGEERVGAGDLAERERVGRDAAAVDRGPELAGVVPKARATTSR